jgi:CheY-like chemotaxis protein
LTRILVVEDDDECRSALRELLETHGFEVTEARNGQAALEQMLLTEEPCLVVLDLEMPVMSGAELLNVMDNYYRLARVPVLILTGRNSTGRISSPAPRHRAVVGVVSKPFDASTFIETVKAHARKPSGSSNPAPMSSSPS